MAATRASSTAISRNASLPPPLVDLILTGLTALLLSPGEWFAGCSSSSYGFFPSRSSFSLGFSTTSTAEHYHQFQFPGTIPEAVPTVIFGGDHHHPHPGGFCHAPPPPTHNHHAPASVAAASALAALPLRPLSQEDLSASLVSDLTMSFLVPNNPPVVVPLTPPPPPPGATTPAPAPSSSQLVIFLTAVPGLQSLSSFRLSGTPKRIWMCTT